MTESTRERVRKQYSRSGVEYDQVRLADPRGRLLSEHDVRLFLDLLPRLAPASDALLGLEVGAGTGRFTLPAIERGYRLIATDVNETMLDQLRAKLASSGQSDRCEVHLDDIFNLSASDATFDFAISLHVIPRFQSLDDQRSAILEVARVLKPGGRFLLNYRNRRSIYGWMHRGHSTTPNQISGILNEAGLRVVEQRGKWILNRRLLNSVPLAIGRVVAAFDRLLWRFSPATSWDVFLVVEKAEE